MKPEEQKKWDEIVRDAAEYQPVVHPRDLAILAADAETRRLQGIPDDGLFHHRLGVEGLFGVTERLTICQLLKDHIESKPIMDKTEGK